MVQGVIFDVDGVLLDSMPLWMHAGEYYLEGKGIVPEDNLGDILFSMSMQEGALYLKERYTLEESVETICEEINDVVIDYYERKIPLKKNIVQTLTYLKQRKIPMVIATSTDEHVILKAFERLHIDSYFERIWTCSQVGAGKDQPDIFQMAAKSIGSIPYKDIYVVEDSLSAIKCAKSLGFKVVGMYDEASSRYWKDICKEADIYAYEMNIDIFQ